MNILTKKTGGFINHKCHICGTNNFKYKYSGFDYMYNIRDKNYRIIKCLNCGLEQIFPTPTREEQISFYPKNYYSKHLNENKKSLKDKLLKLESIIFKIFERDYLKLPNYDGNHNKNFLDVGCGDGNNLKIMEERNRNAEGFEIGNKDFKDNIYYSGSICDVDFKKQYDLIRCNHVFEHVDKPIEFLIKIKKILKNDGKIIINLPNVHGISGYLFGKYAGERDIPRHLYGYNYENIQALFNNQGFKIVHKHKGRQGGTLLSLVFLFIGKYNIDIRKHKIMYMILGILFIPIDFIISIFGNTSSMGFVLMKK